MLLLPTAYMVIGTINTYRDIFARQKFTIFSCIFYLEIQLKQISWEYLVSPPLIVRVFLFSIYIEGILVKHFKFKLIIYNIEHLVGSGPIYSRNIIKSF